MDYPDIITQLDTEIRDKEAWPDDTSKLAEQLRLIYAAAIAIMSVDDLAHFQTVDSPALIKVPDFENPAEYELPDNVFKYREDLGINRAIFETTYGVWIQKNITQQQPFETIYDMADNTFHKRNILFNIKYPERRMIAIHTNNAKIRYVPLPERPDTTTYETLEYPIDDNDAKRAKHMVAAEVSGKTIRDPALSQFQSILSKTY